MTKNAANARAFTLVELILVLSIMAVLAALSVPLLKGFSAGQSITNTADQIVALGNWARTQSVARGVSFRLNFDPAKRTYWLTMQNGAAFENAMQLQDGTQAANSHDGVGEEMGRTFESPQEVSLDCSRIPAQQDGTYVEFRPSGRCDPATLLLSNNEGRQIEIGALSATERFHVLSDDERLLEQTLPPPVAGPAR